MYYDFETGKISIYDESSRSAWERMDGMTPRFRCERCGYTCGVREIRCPSCGAVMSGKEKQMQMKPELFDDEYLYRLLKKLYRECVDKECKDCPAFGSVEDDVCPADLAMELWRRNDNLQERLKWNGE